MKGAPRGIKSKTVIKVSHLPDLPLTGIDPGNSVGALENASEAGLGRSVEKVLCEAALGGSEGNDLSR